MVLCGVVFMSVLYARPLFLSSLLSEKSLERCRFRELVLDLPFSGPAKAPIENRDRFPLTHAISRPAARAFDSADSEVSNTFDFASHRDPLSISRIPKLDSSTANFHIWIFAMFALKSA